MRQNIVKIFSWLRSCIEWKRKIQRFQQYVIKHPQNLSFFKSGNSVYTDSIYTENIRRPSLAEVNVIFTLAFNIHSRIWNFIIRGAFKLDSHLSDFHYYHVSCISISNIWRKNVTGRRMLINNIRHSDFLFFLFSFSVLLGFFSYS